MSDYGDAMRDAFMTDNLRAGLLSDGSKPCAYCCYQPVSEESPHSDSCLDPMCLDSSAAWHEPTAFTPREVADTIPAPAMPEKVSA